MGDGQTVIAPEGGHEPAPAPIPPATAVNAQQVFAPVGKDLADEILQFCKDCTRRYYFNSRWDNVLNVTGILLSVAIVASGLYQKGAISAILGAFVAAIVSAQKAFPFGQRTNFYRILIGQGANLETDVQQGLVSKQDAVAILKSLRLDFAQQLPRGTTFNSDDGPKPPPA